MKLICCDTETGGLDPQKHSLLSVAFCVVDTDAKTISNEMSLVIKEDPLILTEGAMNVNKMTLDEIYREGISPEEAAGRVGSYLSQALDKERAVLLGHNVAFDLGFLTHRLEGVGARFSYRLVDTSTIARFLYTVGIFEKDISGNRDLFDHYGIPKEGRHTALGDCLGTAQVYLKMMEEVVHAWQYVRT